MKTFDKSLEENEKAEFDRKESRPCQDDERCIELIQPNYLRYWIW